MGERRMYKAHKDNCMQCCLCYILDVDQDAVLDISSMPPQFHEQWFQFLNDYLLTNYEKILVPMAEGHKISEMGVGLFLGLDGESTHAVVIDGEDNILWDPNPENPVYGELFLRMALI